MNSFIYTIVIGDIILVTRIFEDGPYKRICRKILEVSWRKFSPNTKKSTNLGKVPLFTRSVLFSLALLLACIFLERLLYTRGEAHLGAQGSTYKHNFVALLLR